MLTSEISLGTAPDTLFELVSYITAASAAPRPKALAKARIPTANVATLDVLGVLEKFPNLRPGPRGLHRGARPLQPTALLDLVVAQRNAWLRHTDGRITSVTSSTKHPPRRRLDLARRGFGAGKPHQGLCSEGPQLRPAFLHRDTRSSWSARHRRGAVPRLPPRPQGRRIEGWSLAVLRPSAPLGRLFLRGGDGELPRRRHLVEDLPGLVARRRDAQDLRAGQDARERQGAVDLAREGLAFLHLRRCQTHGERRGQGARGDRRQRGQAWRRQKPRASWPS